MALAASKLLGQMVGDHDDVSYLASFTRMKHRNVFEAAKCHKHYERDKDIFGVQCGKVWSMGLVDAGSSEQFDEELEQLRERWDNLAPGFHSWFTNKQADTFRNHMISPIHSRANLGSPPTRYTTNANESYILLSRNGWALQRVLGLLLLISYRIWLMLKAMRLCVPFLDLENTSLLLLSLLFISLLLYGIVCQNSHVVSTCVKWYVIIIVRSKNLLNVCGQRIS